MRDQREERKVRFESATERRDEYLEAYKAFEETGRMKDVDRRWIASLHQRAETHRLAVSPPQELGVTDRAFRVQPQLPPPLAGSSPRPCEHRLRPSRRVPPAALDLSPGQRVCEHAPSSPAVRVAAPPSPAAAS